MREAEVANVVVRSISGCLTEQMQQRYSTARGHEQESAIARIIDLTRMQQRVRGSHRSKVDSTGGGSAGAVQLTTRRHHAYLTGTPPDGSRVPRSRDRGLSSRLRDSDRDGRPPSVPRDREAAGGSRRFPRALHPPANILEHACTVHIIVLSR
jgi:hypothetical protein